MVAADRSRGRLHLGQAKRRTADRSPIDAADNRCYESARAAVISLERQDRLGSASVGSIVPPWVPRGSHMIGFSLKCWGIR